MFSTWRCESKNNSTRLRTYAIASNQLDKVHFARGAYPLHPMLTLRNANSSIIDFSCQCSLVVLANGSFTLVNSSIICQISLPNNYTIPITEPALQFSLERFALCLQPRSQATIHRFTRFIVFTFCESLLSMFVADAQIDSVVRQISSRIYFSPSKLTLCLPDQ